MSAASDELVKAHMDALPILIEHVRKSIGGEACLRNWDIARMTKEQREKLQTPA